MGYKTDSSLTFMEDTNNLTYNITESFTGEQIQMVSRVSGSYELISYDERAKTLVILHRWRTHIE